MLMADLTVRTSFVGFGFVKQCDLSQANCSWSCLWVKWPKHLWNFLSPKTSVAIRPLLQITCCGSTIVFYSIVLYVGCGPFQKDAEPVFHYNLIQLLQFQFLECFQCFPPVAMKCEAGARFLFVKLSVDNYNFTVWFKFCVWIPFCIF